MIDEFWYMAHAIDGPFEAAKSELVTLETNEQT